MARKRTDTAAEPPAAGAIATTADPPPPGSTFIVPAGQGRMLRPRLVSPEYVAALRDYSKLLYDGGLVPKASARPEGVAVLIEIGRDVGLPATMAVAWVAIINGRPSIWGDAAAALVRSSGLLVSVREWYEGEGDGYTACCELVRVGAAEPRVARFSVAEAKRARLWGKAGPWTEYPERQLMWRARGWAYRDEFPDVLCGLIFAEEAKDMPRVVVTTDAAEEAEPTRPAATPVVILDAAPPAAAPAPTPEPPAATSEAESPAKMTRETAAEAAAAAFLAAAGAILDPAAYGGKPAAEEPAAATAKFTRPEPPEPAPPTDRTPVTDDQLEECLRLRGLLLTSKSIEDGTDEAVAAWAEFVFVNTTPFGVRSVKHLTSPAADAFILTAGRQLDPFTYPPAPAG